MYGGSGEAQSERLGSGVQQPPETAPERTFGDGQGGGDVCNPVQSGKSKGKSWFSGYAIVRIDPH